MTVGRGGGYAGYGADTGGTLSDDEFSWQGRTYTVEALLLNPFSQTVSVAFSDDVEARDGLTLCLGATGLALSQARHLDARQFYWDNVELNWSDGASVIVGLNNCR